MNVNFPDPVWARLASIAEKRGVKIVDLIVEATHLVLVPPTATTQRAVGPAPAPEPAKPRPGQANRAVLDTNDLETVAIIHELYDLGWSMAETARHMAVSYDSVRSAYSRLGLAPTSKHGKRINVDEAQLVRLQAEGVSDRDIAAELGVSHKKVRAVRREIGIPTAGRPGRKPNHPKESAA